MNKEKTELEPKQVFNFVGYQFDLKEGQGQTHTRALAGLDRQKKSDNSVWSGSYRASDSHGKTSPPRSTSYPYSGIRRTTRGYQNH